MKKPILNSNITELKEIIFTQWFPSDFTQYEYSIKILINYFQQEYSSVVYLGQSIQEVKVPYLALLIKPKKYINQ